MIKLCQVIVLRMESSLDDIAKFVLGNPSEKFYEDEFKIRKTMRWASPFRILLTLTNILNPVSVFANKQKQSVLISYPLVRVWQNKKIKSDQVEYSLLAKLFIYIRVIYILSVVVRGLIVCYLYLKLDDKIDNWTPLVVKGANRTMTCALTNDIYEPDLKLRAQLDWLVYWIRLLGIPSTVRNSIFLFIYTEGSVIILTILFFSLTNESFDLKHVSYAINPISERQRIYSSMLLIAKHIFNIDGNFSKLAEVDDRANMQQPFTASRKASDDFSLLKTQEKVNSHLSAHSDGYDLRFTDTITRCNSTIVDRETTHTIMNQNINTNNTLFSANPFESIRFPKVVSSDGYERILTCFYITFSLIIFMGNVSYLFGFQGIYLREFQLKFMQKCELIKCKLWNRNATLIRDFTLSQDYDHYQQFNQAEFDDYLDYLNRFEAKTGNIFSYFATTAHLSYLEFLIWIKYELLRILTPNCLVMMIEFVFVVVNFTFWLQLYLSTFTTGISFRNDWTYQLRQQMKFSYTIIDRIEEMKQNGLFNEYKCRIKAQQLINNCLLTTYINFELFRKEQCYMIAYSTHVIRILTIMNSGAAIISYSIFMYFSQNNAFVNGCLSLFIFFVYNLSFFGCIRMISEMRLIFRHMERLIVRESSCSLELNPLMLLWRRQMLSDSDVHRIYSIRIFGLELNSENLIRIDSYIIAAALLMYNGGNWSRKSFNYSSFG